MRRGRWYIYLFNELLQMARSLFLWTQQLISRLFIISLTIWHIPGIIIDTNIFNVTDIA